MRFAQRCECPESRSSTSTRERPDQSDAQEQTQRHTEGDLQGEHQPARGGEDQQQQKDDDDHVLKCTAWGGNGRLRRTAEGWKSGMSESG